MKTNIIIILFLSLLICISGCKDENQGIALGPVIGVQDEDLSFDGLNVGEKIILPIEVKSPNGVKRVAFFFVMQTANGTETGTATNFDDPAFPQVIEKDIEFDAVPNMNELVIVAFDRMNVSSELHIPLTNIRSLPQISFTDNIKFRETVFENKMMAVTGKVSSEFDIAKLTYVTVANNVASAETNIPFADKKNIDFAANIEVKSGLQSIIIRATNLHEGTMVDTFKIGSIVGDAVSISMQNGITEIDKLYAEQGNSIGGTISSGSNIASFTYAIKKNDTYSEETAIVLGTPLDEFNFSINIAGQEGIQAIRLSGKNTNNNTLVLELPVKRVIFPLVHLEGVELTTEIRAGKPNWFAAYLAPHVFDQASAVVNQEKMDIMVVVYGGTALRFMPSAVYEAASYTAIVAPYMVGFTKATYTLVTSNRAKITSDAFAGLENDEDLETFIRDKIIAPTSQGGENYNVVGTNRRISTNLAANTGYIIGWGSYVKGGAARNEAFALIYVKEVSFVDGVGHVKFDIKFPKTDYRTMYNPVSITPYP